MTALEKKFTHGQCQLYALVLHAELRKPLVNFFWGTRTRKNYCHSAVLVRSGMFMDATGWHTFAGLQKYWGNARVEEIKLRPQVIGERSARKCLAKWAMKKNFTRDFAQAHRLFRRKYRRPPPGERRAT